MVQGEIDGLKRKECIPPWLSSHRNVERRGKCPDGEKSHLKVSCCHDRFLWHPLYLPIAISNPLLGWDGVHISLVVPWAEHVFAPTSCRHESAEHQGCSGAMICTVLSPTSLFSWPSLPCPSWGWCGGTQCWQPPHLWHHTLLMGPSMHLPQTLLRVLDSIINLRHLWRYIGIQPIIDGIFSSHMIHWEGIRVKCKKYADVMGYFSGAHSLSSPWAFRWAKGAKQTIGNLPLKSC